jgi:predicted transcriptional regulator
MDHLLTTADNTAHTANAKTRDGFVFTWMLTAIFSQEMNMSTAKEEVRKMLERIPDDASFEDIQYHIYIREKIESGLRDIKEGHVLSQEEVEQRMSKWLGK